VKDARSRWSDMERGMLVVLAALLLLLAVRLLG
jgi:hypothetical protein